MKNLIRLGGLVLIGLLLVSGHFPGSGSPCACGGGSAFAQAPATGPATVGSGLITVDAGSGSSAVLVPTPAAAGRLPKLVDLGAGKCVACKKMGPILEEAKKLYEGKAEVVFIDVWENRDAAGPYGIRTIPTQIFFDAAGKEVFRHEGFFPMEDIQKQFESMGVVLKKE